MNSKLLRKVAKRLRGLRHEEHYDQDVYGEATGCGTATCIAGWTLIVSGAVTPRGLPKLHQEEIHDGAMDLLGLTRRQANALFDAEGVGWSHRYHDRFYDAQYGGKKEKPSRVAADLLDALADGKAVLR